MQRDRNELELTALAREPGNKTCFSCTGPGSLVRWCAISRVVVTSDATDDDAARTIGARAVSRDSVELRKAKRYTWAQTL